MCPMAKGKGKGERKGKKGGDSLSVLPLGKGNSRRFPVARRVDSPPGPRFGAASSPRNPVAGGAGSPPGPVAGGAASWRDCGERGEMSLRRTEKWGRAPLRILMPASHRACDKPGALL